MFTNNLIAGAAGNQGGFYNFPIEQSLKFNDDDSSYLSWTPASAGNRKTWTWSGWVKLGNIETDYISIMEAFTGANDVYCTIATSSNQIWVNQDNGAGGVMNVRTSAVFRDPSAWYHLVVSVDTTQATSTNRVKIYVNGVNQTVTFNVTPAQNLDTWVNGANGHRIGARWNLSASGYFDGYLAEVNFIDGQALDASSFGEFKSGVWIPKDPSGLTYGTNGFRLSFQNDTVSEGMNVVTYRGTGATQSINGLGLSPDLIWFKQRSSATSHGLFDSVRGVAANLISNSTSSEFTPTDALLSFDSDGFTVGANTQSGSDINYTSGGSYVAWCWDAGSGSPVSNTDGSITSTVKANAAYGMSIISYTGTGSAATVGHGLNSAPELIIVKNRSNIGNWGIYHSALGATKFIQFTTGAEQTATDWWNDTAPTSTVFSLGTSTDVNQSSSNMIAYAFHSVANYSSVGSYSGNGSTSGPVVNLGFKPAFVMIKGSSLVSQWNILDNTRDTDGVADKRLFANLSNAEGTGINAFNFTSTGFEITTSDAGFNGSGQTYIYIAFADTRDNAFWRDQSGNGNDWQPNNLTYQDSLPDSTTNNFATMNPLDQGSTGGVTVSEGNLKVDSPLNVGIVGSMQILANNGKYYWEVYVGPTTHTSSVTHIGVGNTNFNPNWADTRDSFVYYRMDGGYNGGSAASYTTGDVIGIGMDTDNDEVKFYKNGTLQVTLSAAFDTFKPFITTADGSGSYCIANFGQDSSFAGNKPAQGNTDDNGVGDFYYAPPSGGYLALCSANLPNPTIDPAQDDVPSDYFNTVLYTGNGSTQSVTVGWQPDFTWIKSRTDGGRWHALFDAVRGTEKRLFSNDTSAEDTTANTLTSFDSDGFTLGSQAGQNGAGDSFVSWNWLAGNGTSSNTDGSITSTVSVNQKAGFAAVKWTATSGAQTVGHGLGATPKVVIQKSTSNADDWNVYHASVGSGKYLILNSTAAQTSYSTIWSGVGSSTFPSDTATNSTAGRDYIAYCFAEVEGYSKFGSYQSNTNTTNGTFVYTGFRPSLIICKRTDSTGFWAMLDGTRSSYNVVDDALYANASNAESTGQATDFLSNGFKFRTGDSDVHAGSSASYIYMAFAENPFKYANAR